MIKRAENCRRKRLERRLLSTVNEYAGYYHLRGQKYAFRAGELMKLFSTEEGQEKYRRYEGTMPYKGLRSLSSVQFVTKMMEILHSGEYSYVA